MNKNLLAIAVGAVFVVPGAAFADVKVYGKFNVGIENQKDEIGLDTSSSNDDENTWIVKDNNNSSRLGFKGSEDTGLADLQVIYQLEYGIDPDGTESTAFSERNIFVGLQGGFGTFKVGKFDTPVKEAGAKADLFNDESFGDDSSLLVGETRINNAIQYTTPKFLDGLTVTAVVQPGEGRTALDNSSEQDKGIADTAYASLVYDTKIVYASLSYAYHEAASLKFDGTTAASNIIRGAIYVNPVTDLELSALLQQAKGVDQENSTTDSLTGSSYKETSWLIGAGYSIDAVKLKAQYGETKGDYTDLKRTDLSLGVDYKLSKAFLAQLYYIGIKQDVATTGSSDTKSSAAGLGLVYSF
ncbi:MAG: porin [Solimonas sp.]